MNRFRNMAAGPPAEPRPSASSDVRRQVDAELRAFHAALLALPVPARLDRLVRETPTDRRRAPFDREEGR